MFKKSLIAAALITASVSAAAGTFAPTTPSIISLEGHAVALNKLDINDLGAAVIGTHATYSAGDILTITVEGALFNTATGFTPPTMVATDNAADETFAFIDFVDAGATARFLVDDLAIATDNNLTITTVDLVAASATADTVIKFSSLALSQNQLVGSYDASAALSVATFAPQLVTTVAGLDAVVSTANGRAEFIAANGGQELTDKLNVGFVNGSNNASAIALTKVTHTITGQFGWLMDYDLAANGGDADGVLETGEVATAVAPAATDGDSGTGNPDTFAMTIDTGLTAITVVQTIDANLDNVEFTFKSIGNAAGGTVIAAPQPFTYSHVAAGATAAEGTISQATTSAGGFTLDGSGADIAFLPFGADYAQSITVTNTGAVEGAISVDLTAGGFTYSTTLAAVAAAKSVTNISKEVADFAAASGITGNARVNVTANAPGIVVKGLYYHKPTQDRVLTQ
jgi:hypothetical protein